MRIVVIQIPDETDVHAVFRDLSVTPIPDLTGGFYNGSPIEYDFTMVVDVPNHANHAEVVKAAEMLKK